MARRLNLGNCSDYAVAESLLLLDRWESNILRRQGCLPASQKGDFTRVRNEKLDHHVLYGVKDISEWRLPMDGELELDYVSARLAMPRACRRPENAEEWRNLRGSVSLQWGLLLR